MASHFTTTSPQRHSATLTHADRSKNGQLLPARSQGCSACNFSLQPGRAARRCPRRPGAQHAPAAPAGMSHCAPRAHGCPTTQSLPPLDEILPLEQCTAASSPVRDAAGSGAASPAPSAQAARVAPQGRQAAPQADPLPHAADLGSSEAGQQDRSPLDDESTAYAAGSNPHSDGHAHAPPPLSCG